MDANEYIKKKWGVKEGDVAPYFGIMKSNRTELPKLFCELGYKVGAEIGVLKGIFSNLLCSTIPDLKLYCVDPWYTKPSYAPPRKQLQYYRFAAGHLKKFNVEFLIKESLEALKEVPDDSLDFVYIDGDHHFDYVMTDLIGWSKKVRKGGVISGHDYRWLGGRDIEFAVTAYRNAYKVDDWFLTSEYPTSYLWVK